MKRTDPLENVRLSKENFGGPIDRSNLREADSISDLLRSRNKLTSEAMRLINILRLGTENHKPLTSARRAEIKKELGV